MIINQVVAGSGGGSFLGIPKTIDANGKLNNSSQIIDFTGVADIGEKVLYYAYESNAGVSGQVVMPDLVGITGRNAAYYCFSGCRNITGLSCPNLETVTGGWTFTSIGNNSGMSYAGFPKLRSVSGERFLYNGFGSTGNYNGGTFTADLSKLEEVTGNNAFESAFTNSGMSTISLPLLKKINASEAFAQTFNSCKFVTIGFESLEEVKQNRAMYSLMNNNRSLQSMWFYALDPTLFGTSTTQFDGMLYSCSNVTVHFPIRVQSTIGSWTSVTGGFSGTNTTVLFDLVTSLTGADTNTYTRSEKNSTSTATAWMYNDTLYYTSGVSDNTNGVNEPSVSDAIYSDAACTTSVTTITAIA